LKDYDGGVTEVAETYDPYCPPVILYKYVFNGCTAMTIMAISGHRTEKFFRTYINASGEEHAGIMKRFWDEKTTTNDQEVNPEKGQ
jgi:hypothetical protein